MKITVRFGTLKLKPETELVEMKRGLQIAYIPSHAQGDLSHPDVEFGFVDRITKAGVACRYWRKNHPGELRTVANSEITPHELLIAVDSVPQGIVDGFCEGLFDPE